MDNYTNKPLYGMGMGLLGLASCIGHGIILLVLKEKRDLRKQNSLILSLGISDFLIALHAFASTCAAFSSGWPFGDVGCMVDAFFGMAATFASISATSWIAKQKYYQACKPEKRFNAESKVKCLWIFALIGGGLPFLGFGEYGYETDDLALRTGCLLNFKDVGTKYWIYIMFIAAMWFVWPLHAIIKSYYKISLKAQKVYWLLVVVPLQLLVSLIPYAGFAFTTVFYDVKDIPSSYVALNNIAAKVMIATNPYLYIATDEALSRACGDFLFKNLLEKEKNNNEKKSE